MENEKTENWWHTDYPSYSLQDYRNKIIYQKFSACVKPYDKLSGDYREAFWRDKNCYILEWFYASEQKGEKFGLDYDNYTYFYEHWYHEVGVRILEKSWLCEPNEWGVITKTYEDHEEELSWSIEKEQKVLEFKTKTGNRVDKKVKAMKMTPEGLEDLTEVFWQTPNGFEREKKWTKGTEEGEEKEKKNGDVLCGESWSNDLNQNSKKKWFAEGSHKWGEGEGREGYENWKEKWDKTSQGSVEEIEYEDRFQHYGKVRIRSKSCSFKMDWEGRKPEISLQGKENQETSELGTSLKEIKTQLVGLAKDLKDNLRVEGTESSAIGESVPELLSGIQAELDLLRTLVNQLTGKA